MKYFSKLFLVIICIAIVIRIFVVNWSLQYRENTDVLKYKDWARIAYLYGFGDTYKKDHITFGTDANNEPPGTLYTLYGAYQLDIQTAKILLKLTHATTGHNEWINGPLVTIFLRLPSLIADLLLGIGIYLISKKYTSEKMAILVSSIFLFNPVVLYNSAVWGQTDSLVNVPFLFAVILGIRKKYFLALFLFFCSLYIKISLLPIFPFFILILYFWEKTFIKLLLKIIISLGIFVLFTVPVNTYALSWIVQFFLQTSGGVIPQITAFAFNFWWFVYHPHIVVGDPINLFSFSQVHIEHVPLDSSTLAGIPLYLLGYGIFLISCIPLIFYIVKHKGFIKDTSSIFLVFSVIALLAFLFLPRIHERYMYPMFPLLAIFMSTKKTFIWIYVVLSLLNMVNLYIVWHPMMFFALPYEVIQNQQFQWIISCITIIVSIIFYRKTLKYLHEL